MRSRVSESRRWLTHGDSPQILARPVKPHLPHGTSDFLSGSARPAARQAATGPNRKTGTRFRWPLPSPELGVLPNIERARDGPELKPKSYLWHSKPSDQLPERELSRVSLFSLPLETGCVSSRQIITKTELAMRATSPTQDLPSSSSQRNVSCRRRREQRVLKARRIGPPETRRRARRLGGAHGAPSATPEWEPRNKKPVRAGIRSNGSSCDNLVVC